MASIQDDPLSRLLLGPRSSGRGVGLLQGALLTAWNPVDFSNTVQDGSVTYTDVIVACDPATLVLGRVLLGFTPAGPAILGNSYQKPPPELPEE